MQVNVRLRLASKRKNINNEKDPQSALFIHLHRGYISRDLIPKTIDKHIGIFHLRVTLYSDMAWSIVLLFFIQHGGKRLDNYKYIAGGMDVG